MFGLLLLFYFIVCFHRLFHGYLILSTSSSAVKCDCSLVHNRCWLTKGQPAFSSHLSLKPSVAVPPAPTATLCLNLKQGSGCPQGNSSTLGIRLYWQCECTHEQGEHTARAHSTEILFPKSKFLLFSEKLHTHVQICSTFKTCLSFQTNIGRHHSLKRCYLHFTLLILITVASADTCTV